ncbi:MAG: hypothetical protein FWE43_01400 [Streptococcaceae bacterium]|nr:hypothetical protein [Streptococcaceae bacterium]
MQDQYNTRNKELTYSERQCIDRWHNKDKLSNLLGKAAQTINNELKLGFIQIKTKTKYSAKLAQEHHEVNKKWCGQPSKLTATFNPIILEGCERQTNKQTITRSHSSIVSRRRLSRSVYNWIENGWLDVKYYDLLYPHYKKAKKLRKPQPKRPFGLSIEERPEKINNRSEFGHWEIDTVKKIKVQIKSSLVNI